MNVQIDKTRVSLFSIAGIASGLAVTAFGWGVVYTQLGNRIEENSKQNDRMETHLVAIDTKISPIDTMEYRLTTTQAVVKANYDALNDRLDRIVGSLGGKIDALTETTNGLRTDVKVLTQKVDAGNEKRADLDTLPSQLR